MTAQDVIFNMKHYYIFSGIFKLILTHKKLGMTKEVMANKVIPFLVPLSIENGLSVTQFNTIMMMVKEILSTIENEHRARLEQLNSVRQESQYVFYLILSHFRCLSRFCPSKNNVINYSFEIV